MTKHMELSTVDPEAGIQTAQESRNNASNQEETPLEVALAAEATRPPNSDIIRTSTVVQYRGSPRAKKKAVNKPTQLAAAAAQLNSKFWWLNLGWLVLFTFCIPAAFAVIWFGVIPIGRTNASSEYKEKAVWAFVINPGTYVFFSFMLTNVFFACLDEKNPWRPFWSYAPILAVNYVLQVGIIGTTVFLHGTFPALGLAAITISIVTTLGGLKLLSHTRFDLNKERFERIYGQFIKIMITFAIFWIVLLAYIVTNGQMDSSVQVSNPSVCCVPR